MWLNVFLLVLGLSIIVNIFGVFVGSVVNSNRYNFVAMMYEIAAGMMTGIVCFEMLPESVDISNVYLTIFYSFIGIILTLLLDIYLNKYNKKKQKLINTMAFIIIIAMSIHNIIEGVAIGSSFVYSVSLGITILIANTIHDIPETLVIGIAINKEKNTVKKRIMKSILLALPTAIGSVIGSIIGSISDTYVAISLSVSGGCMLYIVACDLIPSSKEISKNKLVYLTYIIGILIGLFVIKIG
jgi:ZIP family zinc transporter